jgi:ferrous-iron efflux pump FieF
MIGLAPELSAQPDARRAMRLASYASVTVAFILIVAKTSAWFATDSIAVMSSLIDSFLDALASIVTLIAIRHSLRPADREHRFGHGKVEALAALAQSTFITGSAVLLLFEAGARSLDPQEITRRDVAIYVMLFSIVLTFMLVLIQRWAIRKSGSVAISADALHYTSDLLMNAAVIVAILLVTELGWTIADPVFGAGIAVYIIWSAYRILRNSLDMLMDHELSDDEREKIRAIALTHDAIESVHDLRTRQSGLTYFIQLHLEMDGDITLHDAHEIADEVELSLIEAYPGSEIIIHQDPAGVEDAPKF